MADIRCSHCLTLNSAGSETCKNCGRPLLDESAGWLDNLRDGSDSSAWAEPETNAKAGDDAQPAEEIPDWLQRIRQRSQEEQSQPQPFESADQAEEALPDWLQNLTPDSSTEPSAETEDTGDANWLQSLRGAEQPSALEADAPGEPLDAGTADETPDWLRKMQNWQEDTQAQGAVAAAEQPIDEFAQPAGESLASPQEEDQDWLAKLAAQTGSALPAEDAGADWLANLQGGGESSAVVPPIQPSGVTDWLDKLDEPGQEEKEAAPAAEPPFNLSEETTSGGTFSWESEPLAAESAATPENENIDWLREFQHQETPAQEPVLEAQAPEKPEPVNAAGDIPGWLGSLATQEPQETIPAEGIGEPAGEAFELPAQEGMPDWPQNYTPAETPAPAEEPILPISEEPQEETFSWQSLGMSAAESAPAVEDATEAAPFAASELPEWLGQSGSGTPQYAFDQDLIPPAEPASQLQPATPFAQTGLPDWLDESGLALPAPEATGDEQLAEGGDENLEAADLPSWLQSMRPIEMVAPKAVSAEEKKTEKAGPLAGLSGVLPSEDLIGQYIKPPLYSVKLRVSEKQRVHASLIESLISEESQPQTVSAERSEAPQRVLRFLVAAILMLAVLLPMLNFLPALPAASILPQELIAFETTLSDEAVLPRGSAVLLALEYEPGLSGEMQTASEAVIRQLAENDTRLTVISTSPTGPILAESLLAKAGVDPAFVVNLGYLAGGSTGLQSFGLSPVQAAPATLQGQLAPWNSGTLAGVTRLSDFSAVVVLTDDPDKGRNWVEQVQPALGGKPLLMVSSAQAAPLLLPYYNSGQVQGILSGIIGAAGYEALTQSSGTASLLRGSYQYGMLLTALLILLGSLITGIITSISRSKAEKEA
jgi:hypothetical protein